MDKSWKPLLSGGAMLASAGAAMLATSGTASADSITTTTGFNAPVLTGSQHVIASFYASGNPTTSSANHNGTYTDPTHGLDLYTGSYTDFTVGDNHGNDYSPGQSFTTGATTQVLNSIGYALGDAESAAGISTASETIKIYKLNSDGTLSTVYTSTTTGSPYVISVGKKNTQFNFSTPVYLKANTTYVFTLSTNTTDNVAFLTQAKGTSSNPHGTTTQQLVSVNQSDNTFLTYSGLSSRNNSAGQAYNTSPATMSQYSNGTTAIFTPNAAPNISGVSTLGIFNGANSLGIDQLDFYVIASVPEPASLGLLGVAGLGLLARRRKNA